MALEDLQKEPLFSYEVLKQTVDNLEETCDYLTAKTKRQGTFIAALGDFISCYPEINQNHRQTLLDSIREHIRHEHFVLQNRINKIQNDKD